MKIPTVAHSTAQHASTAQHGSTAQHAAVQHNTSSIGSASLMLQSRGPAGDARVIWRGSQRVVACLVVFLVAAVYRSAGMWRTWRVLQQPRAVDTSSMSARETPTVRAARHLLQTTTATRALTPTPDIVSALAVVDEAKGKSCSGVRQVDLIEDPPHVEATAACGKPARRGVFALALFGGVSVRGRTSTSLSSAGVYNSDRISRQSTEFVNVTLVRDHLWRYVVGPSGGQVHTFIHSTVPSLEVQAELLALYQPVSARFDGMYHSVWRQGYEKTAATTGTPYHIISKWASVAAVLRLVRLAEEMRGVSYSKVYMVRLDILLWRAVDVRRYCDDAVYFSNCFEPFFPGRKNGCPSDFHFVASSAVAGNMTQIPADVASTPRPWYTSPNVALHDFLGDKLHVDLRPDHVVIGRHEEVLRKDPTRALMQKYNCIHGDGMSISGSTGQ